MAYADDLVILARWKEALEQVIEEVGLEIGHFKTNWRPTQKQEILWLRAGTEMEQCKEKFAFVGICVTLAATRRQWYSTECCAEVDMHEIEENPDLPIASLFGKEWRHWRKQCGRVCCGELLRGTRERHGMKH